MGPVQHQKLMRVLACMVAFNLIVAVGALYVRDGFAAASGGVASPPPGAEPSATAASPSTGPAGILAAGTFSKRRRSGQQSTPAGTPGAPGTDGAAGASGSATGAARGATTTSTAPTLAPTTATTATTATTPAPPRANARSRPSAGQTTLSFHDPPGDTLIDGDGVARPEPRADIVQSRANYLGSAIILAVKAADPVDPAQDPRWNSDSTYVAWELDTNGDAEPDFEVQYSLVDGSPVAGVSRIGDTDVASLCEAEAGITADGYTVAFAPDCVGTPASFSYRVTTYYDTDPTNEDADVVGDIAPNGGLTRPVSRP